MLNKYFKYLYKSLSFCFSSITIKQQIFSISKEEKKKKPQAVSSIDASGDEVVMWPYQCLYWYCNVNEEPLEDIVDKTTKVLDNRL